MRTSEEKDPEEKDPDAEPPPMGASPMRAVRARGRAPRAALAWLVLALGACGRPLAAPPGDGGSSPGPGHGPAGGGGPYAFPNVLFVAVDDLNDWIGALGGHPQARTPNIDRLVERGVLFTNAHAAAPACNPSRVATLTGIHPARSGFTRNDQVLREVLPDVVTLPQSFRRDYKVLGAGKVFHAPDQRSWDIRFPSAHRQRPSDPVPADLPANGIRGAAGLDWGPIDVPEEQMSDAQVVDWVVDCLLQEHERPVFLACGIFRPHLPWYVPRAYFEELPLELVELPSVEERDLDDLPSSAVEIALSSHDHEVVLRHDAWRAAVQGYLAAIRFADVQVGRLLDALDASGRRDDTIIVLWSDHGWHLGEKSHWRKFSLWEESTRVPLAFVFPGRLPAGRRVSEPVSLVDVFPTLLELTGQPRRDGLDGRSLVPLMRGPGGSDQVELQRREGWSEVPAMTVFRDLGRSVRSRDFRYTRYADGGEELYDHRVDPSEWSNVAADADYAGVKEVLARWMDAGPFLAGRRR